MAGPFDHLKFVGPEPVEQAPVEETGFLRGVADTGIAAARGVTTGVKSVADAFGPNPVSSGLDSVAKGLDSLESPARQAERARRADTIRAAEATGSTWEELKAYLGAFGDAPLDTVVEGLGTSLPTILAAMAGGAAAPVALARFAPAVAARLGAGGTAAMAANAARATGAVAGGVQGAGAVKGAIYERVQREALAAGDSPEVAAAKAEQAQAYTGTNAPDIALGAGLGVLAGTTGAEGAVARRAAGASGSQRAARYAAGVLGTMGAEGGTEFLQGGQERFAENAAAIRAGFPGDVTTGVVGQGALEAVAGAGAGGAAHIAFHREQPQPQPMPGQPAAPGAMTPSGQVVPPGGWPAGTGAWAQNPAGPAPAAPTPAPAAPQSPGPAPQPAPPAPQSPGPAPQSPAPAPQSPVSPPPAATVAPAPEEPAIPPGAEVVPPVTPASGPLVRAANQGEPVAPPSPAVLAQQAADERAREVEGLTAQLTDIEKRIQDVLTAVGENGVVPGSPADQVMQDLVGRRTALQDALGIKPPARPTMAGPDPQPQLPPSDAELAALMADPDMAAAMGELGGILGTKPAAAAKPAEPAPAPAEAKAAGVQQPRTKPAPKNPFGAFLRKHGIDPDTARDILGEDAMRGNRMLPGSIRRGGMLIDKLAEAAVEAGYLTPGDLKAEDDIGGTRKLAELIRGALERKEQVQSVRQTEAGLDEQMQAAAEARYGEEPAGPPRPSEMDDEGGLIQDEPDPDAADAELAPLIQSMMDELESIVGEDAAIAVGERLSRMLEGRSADDYATQLGVILGRAQAQAAARAGANQDAAGPDPGAGPQGGEGSGRGAEGQEGGQEDPPVLTSYTPEEVVRRQEEQAAADKARRDEEAAAAARAKAERDARESRARADQTVDDFQLGQSAEQQLSGQGDLLAAPAPSSSESEQGGVDWERLRTMPGYYGDARQPLRFASGMSRVPDFTAALEAGQSVGVEIGELSGRAAEELGRGLAENESAYLFVDTGAFSVFRANLRAAADRQITLPELGAGGRALDFDEILDGFAKLDSAIAAADREQRDDGGSNARAFFVMPDIVGDQAGSIELAARYKDEIRSRSIRAIVPLQKGALDPVQAFDALRRAVGLGDQDTLLIGVPSNERAFDLSDLRKLVSERGDFIEGLHFLGAASDSKLQPKLDVLVELGYDGNVSSDANRLRALISGDTDRGRAMQELLAGGMTAKPKNSSRKRTNKPAAEPAPVDDPVTAAARRAVEGPLGRGIFMPNIAQSFAISARKEGIPEQALRDAVLAELERTGRGGIADELRPVLDATRATAPEFTTPGTRVTWAGVDGWIEALGKIDARRASAATYAATEAHFAQLTENADAVVANASLEELERLRVRLKSWQNPGQESLTSERRRIILDAVSRRENALGKAAATNRPAADPLQAQLDAVKDELGAEIDKLAGILGAKKNITPEDRARLLPVLSKVGGLLMKAGYLKFRLWGRKLIDLVRAQLGDDAANQLTIKDLQGAYIMASQDYPGTDGVLDVASVQSLEQLNEDPNDQRRGPDLEPDRPGRPPADPVGPQVDAAPAGRDERPARAGTPGTGGTGNRPDGRPGVPDDGAPGVRAAGDPGVSPLEPGHDRPAGDQLGEGGLRGGGDRLQPEPDAEDDAGKAPEQGAKSLADRVREQEDAEPIDVVPGDLDNIRATLPLLLSGQQDDVAFAEARFAKPDGHGVMFTNGTGTGKTMLALGIIKRQVKQGRENVLVLVPNAGVKDQWIRDGKLLQLKVTELEDTKDPGKGVVVTTYANFWQNRSLVDREWDLIVPDESHNLMSGKDGDETVFLEMFRALSAHPQGFQKWFELKERVLYDQLAAARDAKDAARENKTIAEIELKRSARKAEFEARTRAKALFLSATPFAYEKALRYAEGFLYQYGEDGERGFLQQHFGWRIRYNKLTKPDAKVDSSLLQVRFNQYLKDQGVLSGRMLDSEFDYDRRFWTIDDAVGRKIDEGALFLREGEDGRWRALYDLYEKQFDYLTRARLLEAIKARHVAPLIRKYVELGRKVVVFHDYKSGGGFAPFQFAITDRTMVRTKDENGRDVMVELPKLIAQFRAARPDLWNMDFSDYPDPITALSKEFGEKELGIYNGDVSDKKRAKIKGEFNADGSELKVVLVQAQAGGAGLSLHDTTGTNPRVLINLGLPVAPVTAIQQEGRIYRVGQRSNAPFRYLNTGTTFESNTFARKIAERVDTVENLGMGSLARGLKRAFVMAFNGATEPDPGADGEGTGGKALDRSLARKARPSDEARTLYWAQKKRGQRDKAAEGEDYYPTPEPIGLAMANWMGLRNGERALEPSAGHGAIAQWFGEQLDRTALEPSLELSTRLRLAFDGKVREERFEDLDIGANKFDGIAMNPPFGHAGAKAIAHLAKAFKHLNNGGRIVAILPRGATDAKFDTLMMGPQAKGFWIRASIELPGIAFERAGTKVRSRLVIIDRLDGNGSGLTQRSPIDLSKVEDINELFDRIEAIEMPMRPGVTKAQMAPDATPLTEEQRAGAAALSSVGGRVSFTTQDTTARSGEPALYARMDRRVPDEAFEALRAMARRHNGWWSGFGKPGFIFRKHADRDAFVREAGGMTGTDAMMSKVAPGELDERTDQTQTEAFKRWFGDSKVVDEQGRPLVVYHGTTRPEFTVFDRKKTLEWRGPSMDTVGSWFSSNPSDKDGAGMYAAGGDSAIYPAFLSIQNPKVYRTFNDFLREMHAAAGRKVPENAPGRGSPEELRAKLKEEGYDGIEFEQTANGSLMRDIVEMQAAIERAKKDEFSVRRAERAPYTMKRERLEQTLRSMRKELDEYGSSTEFDRQRVFIAFEPEQIKSATGNRGTFDPANPDILYSLAEPRRRAITAMAAAAIAPRVGRAGPLTIGRAQAVAEQVLASKVSAEVEAVLRGEEGQKRPGPRDRAITSPDGGKRIRRALDMIAKSGPPELRALAASIAKLMPDTGVVVTVDDITAIRAHGIVRPFPIPEMRLFTRDGRQGLSHATFLHEALHVAVMARYRAISVAIPRSNDARLGVPAPKAAAAIEQFNAVWKEFGDMAAIEVRGMTDRQMKLSLEEAISNPDEFFVRALTDAGLQQWMAAREYKGKTLWQRFKDWVKTSLFGLSREGTAPSWLDAALAATNDLVAAMETDPADFARLQASSALEDRARGGQQRDAMYARMPTAAQARNVVHDLMKSHKNFNWWHKTIGTQYEKAQSNPYFKAVFDRVQTFLDDISRFANEAADLAPTMLPKLGRISDVFDPKDPLGRKRAADARAIARPIFEGTLHDPDPAKGKVWTDQELRTQYQLTADQIRMYREFRAAVDRSLDTSLRATLVKVLGDKVVAIADQIMAAPDATALESLIVGHLQQLQAAAAQNRQAAFADAITDTRDKIKRIEGLKAGGYAPLMRFGNHSVYAYKVDPVTGDIDQLYFGMYDTEREANAARRALEADPQMAGAIFEQGPVPTEAFKLFNGVDPDAVELFAQAAGVTNDEMVQQYIKLTKNNRSALRRMIKRTGLEGFSQDTTRTLAAFITSSSRQASMDLHSGQMKQAAEQIPKTQGDVQNEAVRLIEYVQTPSDTGAKIRSLLFFQFIGGSIASAITNLTQPLTMTFPYLSQFGGATMAARELTRGGKEATTGVRDPQLAAALARAEDEGVVSPQEIHHLYAEAGAGVSANSAWRRFSFAWGSLFSASEQWNRRTTFIAAYRIAQANGHADPFAFAEQAVEETQGIYNKGNRPNWARGAVGGLVLTFKQFSVAYVEFFKRLPRKQKAIALAVLILFAGLEGVPFAEDAQDVADTLLQAAGYNFSSKRAMRQFAARIVGQDAAEFIMRGTSTIPGFPIDVSARMGLGNLVPGTGLFMQSKADKTRELTEPLGAFGSLVRQGLLASEKALEGEFGAAARSLAPVAAANVARGTDMFATGMYRDERGRRVTDTSTLDAMVKSIGFQPAGVAQAQRTVTMALQRIDMARNREGKIAEKWARGIFERNSELVAEARQEMADWNAKNPDSRIAINSAQIQRRVKAMRLSRADRIAKAAPREFRKSVQDEVGAMR